MKKLQRQKGFTLVELAIVLTIVGLLIGGILKGQQLMTNARITATMAQVKAIEAAKTTFQDTYNVLPGDMSAPNTRLNGFSNTTVMASLGDGQVGATAAAPWNLIATLAAAPANPAAVVGNETVLFWGELSSGGLLSGITYAGAAAPVVSFGTTHPVARIGGGFWVGTINGSTQQQLNVQPAVGNGRALLASGLVLALVPTVNAALVNTVGGNALSPNVAAQIDRKMDDGNSLTGSVQAFGNDTSAAIGCFNGALAPYAYNESLTGKDCGLLFNIQG